MNTDADIISYGTYVYSGHPQAQILFLIPTL